MHNAVDMCAGAVQIDLSVRLESACGRCTSPSHVRRHCGLSGLDLIILAANRTLQILVDCTLHFDFFRLNYRKFSLVACHAHVRIICLDRCPHL